MRKLNMTKPVNKSQRIKTIEISYYADGEWLYGDPMDMHIPWNINWYARRYKVHSKWMNGVYKHRKVDTRRILFLPSDSTTKQIRLAVGMALLLDELNNRPRKNG